MAEARDRESAGPDPRELAFGRVLDQLEDAAILTQREGVIVLWNAAATRLLGFSEEEARQQPLSRLLPEAPLDAQAAQTFRARRSDGSVVWVEATTSTLQANGAPLLLHLLRDVTERVRRREDEAKDRKQLRQANEGLEAFAYVIAHDLKEPVRATSFYLDEAQGAEDAQERALLLAKAREAHAGLQRLLQGLLEWSRMATQSIEAKPQRIHEVLQGQGAAQYRDLAQERRARVEISPSIPPVLGTEALLCRIFGNLITNAIRHNPRDAPNVRVHEGRSGMGFVEILVDDDGPGFPPALRERFGRTGDLPTSLKSGFGLAITQRAVEHLHGTMRLGEARGGGGRVVVRLPTPAYRPTLEERVRELV